MHLDIVAPATTGIQRYNQSKSYYFHGCPIVCVHCGVKPTFPLFVHVLPALSCLNRKDLQPRLTRSLFELPQQPKYVHNKHPSLVIASLFAFTHGDAVSPGTRRLLSMIAQVTPGRVGASSA